MSMNWLKVLCVCGLLAGLSGCAAARVTEELLPSYQAETPTLESSIEVFEEGISTPSRGFIPFVRLVANGNGYATKEILVAALRKRTAELGGDLVMYAAPKTSSGPTVVSYSNGLALADTIKYPYIQATGCRWSRVRLGFRFDQSLHIMDVIPGSPAATNGVQIGERLLAINSQRVTGDYVGVYRALGELRPGQLVTLEFARADNTIHTVTMTAEANQ